MACIWGCTFALELIELAQQFWLDLVCYDLKQFAFSLVQKNPNKLVYKKTQQKTNKLVHLRNNSLIKKHLSVRGFSCSEYFPINFLR